MVTLLTVLVSIMVVTVRSCSIYCPDTAPPCVDEELGRVDNLCRGFLGCVTLEECQELNNKLEVTEKVSNLLCQDVTANAVEFESMVLSSLPRTLALSSIPDLDRSHTFLSPGCVSHSVRLPLPQSVSAREVLTAIQSIAKTFLKEEGQRRMSLVRPDDGWFPGIEKIRADLADTIQQCSREVSNRSKEELRVPLGRTKGWNQGREQGREGEARGA